MVEMVGNTVYTVYKGSHWAVQGLVIKLEKWCGESVQSAGNWNFPIVCPLKRHLNCRDILWGQTKNTLHHPEDDIWLFFSSALPLTLTCYVGKVTSNSNRLTLHWTLLMISLKIDIAWYYIGTTFSRCYFIHDICSLISTLLYRKCDEFWMVSFTQ